MEFTKQEIMLMDTMDRVRRIRLSRLHPWISKGEFCLLCAVCLSGEKGIKASDLVEELQVPAPAVSRLMKGMEQKDLIRRRMGEVDRRSIVVTATRKGQELNLKVIEGLHEFWQELFERISAEDFDEMLASVNRVMDYMEVLLQERTEAGTEQEVQK